MRSSATSALIASLVVFAAAALWRSGALSAQATNPADCPGSGSPLCYTKKEHVCTGYTMTTGDCNRWEEVVRYYYYPDLRGGGGIVGTPL